MDKVKAKISGAQYNKQAVSAVAEKYGFGDYYIRQSVKGTAKGVMPDVLKKEYKKLESEINIKTQEIIDNYLKN